VLSADQQARLLVASDAHWSLLEHAIAPVTGPDDRWIRQGILERGVAGSEETVEVLLAWMARLTADETLRPLNADLEVSWPSAPDPADVEIAVRLATNPRCWYYEIRAALTLAEQVLADSPPGAGLVEALLELRSRLEDDRLHSSEYFRTKLLPWVRSLIAETTPADLVDLSFIDIRDAWGPAVIDLVQNSANPASSARSFLHLRSPRGSTPSRDWWTSTSQMLASDPHLGVAITRSLELITEADLTSSDQERDGWDVPDQFLLAPTNETLGRGMAWATQLLEPSHDVCDLLGRVTLRAAVMVWATPAHRMICPKVAYATVDSLMGFDTDEANDQLSKLVSEIRFPILIRRIAEHLGESTDTIDGRIAALKDRGPLPRPDRD
jgi:hypothetical protein